MATSTDFVDDGEVEQGPEISSGGEGDDDVPDEPFEGVDDEKHHDVQHSTAPAVPQFHADPAIGASVEDAVEARLAAARDATRRRRQDVLGRGTGARARTATLDGTDEALPAAPLPGGDILHENKLLRQEVAGLRKQQQEAAKALVVAQERYAQNLVKLKERHAKLASSIASKEQQVAELKRSLGTAETMLQGAQDVSNDYRDKLHKRDATIAELRMQLEKLTQANKRLTKECSGKGWLWKDTLSKIDGMEEIRGDAEVEAVLSSVDLEALRSQSNEGFTTVSRLLKLLDAAKKEITRQRALIALTREKEKERKVAPKQLPTAKPLTPRSVNPPGEERKGVPFEEWVERKKKEEKRSEGAVPRPVWRPGGNSPAKLRPDRPQPATPRKLSEAQPAPRQPDLTMQSQPTNEGAAPEIQTHTEPQTTSGKDPRLLARVPPQGLLALVGGSAPAETSCKPAATLADSPVFTFVNH
eukprot:Sspe_Gene.14675::Locus_5085_Transcript_1_1_Confidence_1.000_Length_1613::g.14675::m.14675